MKLISTTALAKRHQRKTRDLFSLLLEMGLIVKNEESWELTDEGKQRGGQYKESKQYGKYIVWPEDLVLNSNGKSEIARLMSATAIGKAFDLSAVKMNYILSELGWISKGIKGWVVSEQGLKHGGVQDEAKGSGVPFVRWPEEILNSKILKETISQFQGEEDHGGKDCTKVDRSAAYASRYVAKNIVAAGLADRCEIQVAYAIGVSCPLSINVETFGTGKLPDARIAELVDELFDLRPGAIIRDFDLRRPIYQQTASYGHFGRDDLDLPWERLDRVDALRAAAGLATAAD